MKNRKKPIILIFFLTLSISIFFEKIIKKYIFTEENTVNMEASTKKEFATQRALAEKSQTATKLQYGGNNLEKASILENSNSSAAPDSMNNMSKQDIESAIINDIYYYNDEQLLAAISTINRLSLTSESITFFLADIIQQQEIIESENIDIFAKALTYNNNNTQAETLTAEYVLDALSHIMYEIDKGYRPSVVDAMLSWKDVGVEKRVEESIFGFLSSTSVDVAKTAVSALGKIGTESSDNKLHELAYSENTSLELRREAWNVISQKGMTEEMSHSFEQFNEENK